MLGVVIKEEQGRKPTQSGGEGNGRSCLLGHAGGQVKQGLVGNSRKSGFYSERKESFKVLENKVVSGLQL